MFIFQKSSTGGLFRPSLTITLFYRKLEKATQCLLQFDKTVQQQWKKIESLTKRLEEAEAHQTETEAITYWKNKSEETKGLMEFTIKEQNEKNKTFYARMMDEARGFKAL